MTPQGLEERKRLRLATRKDRHNGKDHRTIYLHAWFAKLKPSEREAIHKAFRQMKRN